MTIVLTTATQCSLAFPLLFLPHHYDLRYFFHCHFSVSKSSITLITTTSTRTTTIIIYKNISKKVLTAGMDFWRRFAGISHLDKVPNNRVRKIMEIEDRTKLQVINLIFGQSLKFQFFRFIKTC